MAWRRPARARKKPDALIVGIAWYDAVQWAKLKLIAPDADKLDDSYEDWLKQAEDLEWQLRREGMDIRRVAIDIEALEAWCHSRQRPIDGESRSKYTAELASRPQQQ